MTDHETTAAVEALAYRLRNRPPDTDDDIFALEYITALRARGWRPTEAKPAHPWRNDRHTPAPGTAERGAALARELLAQHEGTD